MLSKPNLALWVRRCRADGLAAIRIMRRGFEKPVRTWIFKDHPSNDDGALMELLLREVEAHAKKHAPVDGGSMYYFFEGLLTERSEIGERRFTIVLTADEARPASAPPLN